MIEKLKKIKILFLDADGVLFNGQESRCIINNDSIILKSRSHIDGQGISFIREMGIKIVFVSGEGEPLNGVVDKMNNLPSCTSGRWQNVEVFPEKNNNGQKLETIIKFLSNNNVAISDVAYMGDDVNDYEPMVKINEGGGLTVTPANSTRKILPIAQIKTKAAGGDGAIRELAHMIIDARSLDETKFPVA